MILKELKSGRIELVDGGDGIFLRFDCECKDALPYCRARCCNLPGIGVTLDEAMAMRRDRGAAWIKLHLIPGDGGVEMRRAATGWCQQNDPTTKLCGIYEDRPHTCSDFHCTRSNDARGWRLELDKLD